MKKHLAILTRKSIKAIISGQKTLEIRFSQKKIAPFGVVSVGDEVYMKPPGEEIAGQFEVKKVISIEGLDQSDWQFIESLKSKISLGSQAKSFLENHASARYATIISIGQVEQFVTSPIKIQKKDLRGWVVLEN